LNIQGISSFLFSFPRFKPKLVLEYVSAFQKKTIEAQRLRLGQIRETSEFKPQETAKSESSQERSMPDKNDR